MLEIGWSELLVIGIVAIIVVGPKELPNLLRTISKGLGAARRMAGDFQSQFNEALREAELDDVRKSVEDLRSLNPANMMRDAIENAGKPVTDAVAGVKSDLDLTKAATTGSAFAAGQTITPATPSATPATTAAPPAPPPVIVEAPAPPLVLDPGPPVIATAPAPASSPAPAAPAKRTAAKSTAAKSAPAADTAAAEAPKKPSRARKGTA